MVDKRLPKIALGVWAWGNDGTFGGHIDISELKSIVATAMDANLYLWDTAYAYGMGTSEKVLAERLRDVPRKNYLISDKLTPQCMDVTSDNPVAAMYDLQLKLMGLDYFDIYWVHNASEAPRWTRALAEYFEHREHIPMIGVSNHNLQEIKEADAILRAHGLRLGAVQNHLSFINRSSIDSGILDWCQQNDVTFFSYMVLEQGALSGKYDTTHPMPEESARAATYNPVLDKLEILNLQLMKLAQKYSVGVAQVPVAWAIAKNTVPIIGVTKPQHVQGAVAATTIKLSDSEVSELERLADSLQINAVRPWEKLMN